MCVLDKSIKITNMNSTVKYERAVLEVEIDFSIEECLGACVCVVVWLVCW